MTTDPYRSSGPIARSQAASPDPATARPSPVAPGQKRSVAEVAGASTTATPDAVIRKGFARRHRRQNLALLVTASVLGVWLGTGAPGTSPVAPGIPVVQAAVVPAALAPAPVAPNPAAVVPAPA